MVSIELWYRHDFLYAVFLISGVLATFKPYPTLSDPGLFLTMWMLFPETYACKLHFGLSALSAIFNTILFTDLRHPIVTTLIHLHAFLLLPLFNHLWLATGTGNANFFYASTLVFGMANGAGLLDAIWAGLACAIPVGDEWDVSQE
jgi:GPI-anchor transamidase subunit U